IRFVHQVSDKNIFSAIAIKISGIDSHAGLSLSIPIQRSPCQKGFVLERAVLLVYPELIGIAVIGNVYVDPAVAIEIRSDHSQAMSKLFVQTCCYGHIFKSAVALVMKKPIAGSVENPRCTIVSRTGGGVTGRAVGNRKIGVVNNNQVKPTV